MVLARPGSEVIKIDCSTHPRILGAKRLLQHNLFNGGSPGRICVAGGWRVDCHRRAMIERRHVTSPGTLTWECEEGTCGTFWVYTQELSLTHGEAVVILTGDQMDWTFYTFQ